MSDALALQKPKPLTPDELQNMASNPHESVWVSASAGTGKTKVLTDRVLRLLLPRSNGQAATYAHKILCLTYTKAAASEMALRVNDTLGKWAVMDEMALYAALKKLLNTAPSEEQINAARRLFAQIVDSAQGLQIMTIHSFCQSILGRFPLEADLAPNFEVLHEDDASALLRQAQNDVLVLAQSPDYAGSDLHNALLCISREIDESTFLKLLQEISAERFQLQKILTENHTSLHQRLCNFYQITPDMTTQDILNNLCLAYTSGLEICAQSMQAKGGKKEQEYAPIILSWLNGDLEYRQKNLQSYRDIFINKSDGLPRTHHFPTQKVLALHPQAAEILLAESERILAAQDTIMKINAAALTRDLMILGKEIVARYETLKAQQSVMDFNDMILRTLALLRGKTARLQELQIVDMPSWIMFKMDQGIDHILLDEAQDTNPEQWKIIESICDEFFSGQSAREYVQRTSFTVGDIKQSIYSFQRAAPEEFKRMQGHFAHKITASGNINRIIALDTSFRSTVPVLAAVDSIFADPILQKGVGEDSIHHRSFRIGQAGTVEIWPLFETEKAEKTDFWNPPSVREQNSASSMLATYIANKIKFWLENKEILPAYNRPIDAGDIMVLVRTRSSFVDQLVRALKKNNIPVSGVDRMVLNDQLAVQDMTALARFALLPQDDLTLACVLKSPFIGMDENMLFDLAYDRTNSLWDALRDKGDPKIYTYLKNITEQAIHLPVYEFFGYILNASCPADAHSGLRAIHARLGEDALDPLQEFMNTALEFSRDHIDHLELFLDKQEQKSTQIKRELEESGEQVRIMTVHGSKGLQAPIVIMPDTILTNTGRSISRLIWPDKSGLDIPLWTPRKDDQPKAYTDVYEAAKSLNTQESFRLLYVAMTRAADRLYIAGYTGIKKPLEHSWYFLIRDGLKRIEDVEELEDGSLRLSSTQNAAPDKEKADAHNITQKSDMPSWIFKGAPQEPSPPRPLVPSRPSQAEDQARLPALSPLKSTDEYRFRRGNITHKLLQFLPDFASEKMEQAARRFVEKIAQDLPAQIRAGIVTEVISILTNPDFAPFFAVNSLAEVPVTGMMDAHIIISGQIDRLVIGKNDIRIVDYKTNRPPPVDPCDIPDIYRKQMNAYRQCIQKIYPEHMVHCALLWTDGPRMMIVDP